MKKLIIFLLLTCIGLLPSTVLAVSMHDFKLNGFIDLEYEKSDGPGHPMTPVGDENGSFDQYHLNILMEFPVNDHLTVKGHLEFEHSPMVPKTGDIKTEWAYLEYAFNNSISVRAGSFLTPVGIYNEIHDAVTTYNSVRVPFQIYRADKRGGFAMFPKFGTGITVLGDYFTDSDMHINYSVFIINGENTVNNDAERDDNDNKAVGGKFSLSPVSGLSIFGSYFTGHKGAAEDDHSTWVGSIDYHINHFHLRAEYASSKLNDTTETGWYSELSYSIGAVTPYIRYGSLDPDADQNKDKWTEFVYGINYEFVPGFIGKIENRNFIGETGNSSVSEDYNELGAAVTVAF